MLPETDFENGRVTVSGRLVGSVMEYWCNEGFELVGSSARSCLENATWSGIDPNCGKMRIDIYKYHKAEILPVSYG